VAERYLNLARDKKQYFSLPEGWTVVGRREQGGEAPRPVEEIIAAALDGLSGAASIAGLTRSAKNIAIIIDDGTRPTPVGPILKVLLQRLLGAGVATADVTIVAALGTHARMDERTLEERLGRNVVAHYRIVQHDAWQPDLVPIAVPGYERTVRVAPDVLRADVRISISSILPHPMAGYGGGPKMLMPGVCDIETIMDHHMKLTVHPAARACAIDGNPFQEVCMRVAKAIGLNLSINCVYNELGEVAEIVAGSLEEAFRKAADLTGRLLGYRLDEKVDVCIGSTYPHTHGVQLFKGLVAAHEVTRDDGVILMVVPLVKPLPDEFLDTYRQVQEMGGGNPVEYARGRMERGIPFLLDKSTEFNMGMYCAVFRPPVRTVLVSPLIPEATARKLGFDYAPSLEEGIATAHAVKPNARVAILPSAGLVVPIVT
jgi:nickel-dependent lactate racemase